MVLQEGFTLAVDFLLTSLVPGKVGLGVSKLSLEVDSVAVGVVSQLLVE